MDELSRKHGIMRDLNNELRANSASYSDIKVVEISQKAIDYAYENFKERENDYEGYLYKYETRIANVALGIDAHLQKNTKNKKSLHIKNFVLDVINNEKYGRGRSGFVFLLYILKMDGELKTIATERKDFWETPRIRFQLIYALYKRKITGFTREAELLLANNPKETELKKYAKKYMETF